MNNDLISRQAAIDEINERQRKLIYCFGFENDVVKIMDIAKSIITALPSVQPEIVRCKDCKWKQGAECVMFADVRPFPDDFCSRAERRTDD